MSKKQLSFILIISFVFILAWLIFNIAHDAVSSTISGNLNIQIAPISPNFDTTVIDKLKTREQITPILQINEKNDVVENKQATTSGIIDVSPTPTTEPTITQPVATAAAIPATGQ